MLEHRLWSLPNINATSGECLFCWAGVAYYIGPVHVYWQASRAKMLNQSWLNVVQCRRWWTKRWTNIDSTSPCVSWVLLCLLLGQTDHTGKHAYRRAIACRQRCFNAGTPSTTLAQHLVSVAVLGLLLMTGVLPSKHEMLTQCCFNAGPTSEMAGQHSNNIGIL